jgi:hypothetical protein
MKKDVKYSWMFVFRETEKRYLLGFGSVPNAVTE